VTREQIQEAAVRNFLLLQIRNRGDQPFGSDGHA
jgi:hypothetical protein